jgi:hypothetical protein
MLTPDLFVLRMIAGVSHLPQRPVPDSTARTLLERAGRRGYDGANRDGNKLLKGTLNP